MKKLLVLSAFVFIVFSCADKKPSIIKNGKGTMTPFSAILNADQINAIAAYTFQLK